MHKIIQPAAACLWCLMIFVGTACKDSKSEDSKLDTETNGDSEDTATEDSGENATDTASEDTTDSGTFDFDIHDTSCPNMPGEGCCNGDIVMWCFDGEVDFINCATNSEGGDFCGWSAEYELFDCAETDPVPADQTVECAKSSVCDQMPSDGCCDGDQLYWCDNGVLMTIDCAQMAAPMNHCGYDLVNKGFDCNPGTETVPDGSTATCPAGI